MNANTLTSSRGMCSYIRAQQKPSYPWHSALLEEANIRSFPTCLPYGHSMLTPALLRAKGENWNFKMMCEVRREETRGPFLVHTQQSPATALRDTSLTSKYRDCASLQAGFISAHFLTAAPVLHCSPCPLPEQGTGHALDNA